MSPVLTVCPVSGNLVPTGVDADSLDEIAPENVLLDCPDCGGDHVWTAVDAVLAPG